jgi:hypothetical protein
MKDFRLASLIMVLLVPLLLHAQKADIAVTVGAAVSPDGKGPVRCGEAILCQVPPGTIGPVSLGPGISWQVSLAYRVVDFRAAALYVELPFAGSPSRTGPAGLIIPGEFSSFFLTPSAQLKLLPRGFASPFASVGGGLAHFSTTGSGGNAGALQVGGGVDFRTPLRVLGIRAEARDFITGHPAVFPLGAFTSRVQHVFAGGGVLLKF